MKSFFIDRPVVYTGTQLTSRWIEQVFGIAGNSIIGFIGPHYSTDDSIESDPLKEDVVASELMLNFMIEHFDCSLKEIGLLHHLFCAQVIKTLGPGFNRRKQNIFFEKQKLSISHIRHMPTSSLIYMGFHLKSDPNDSLVISFEELGIKAKQFAVSVMQAYTHDVNQILEESVVMS